MMINEGTSNDSRLVTDLSELGTTDTISNQGYFPPMKINISEHKYVPVKFQTEYIDYNLDAIFYTNGGLSIRIEAIPTKIFFLSRFELMDIGE